MLAGWGARVRRGRSRLAISLIAMLVLVTGGYYVARYVQMLILLSSVVGEHNFVEDAVKNGRGDKVKIRTDASGRYQDPDKTVVRLRRSHDWFSTKLVETDSFGVEEKLKWLNDDNLEVSIGFGCLVDMMRPIEHVGPIHISYHFTNGDQALSKGCPG